MANRILLVDDDIDLLNTLVRLLGRFGYSCVTACSGGEGLRLMEAESPDLVVTDLRMPGTDGIAVARHARGHAPPIAVLMMTAYHTRETRQQAEALGAAACLAKPFASVDFVSAVQRALGGSWGREPARVA